MTILTERGRERLERELSYLYPGREALLMPRVEEIASRRAPAAGRIAGDLSARDAILIAYADMLRSEGAVPLRLLGDFAERRAAGHFSLMHILPFYPSSSDEGYSVMDYRSVDPEFGGWEDIARIGGKLGLVFDLVLNHASARSGWFRAFLEDREPYRRFFLTRPGDYDASKVFRPRTHPLLTAFRRADGGEVHAWTTFSADQVDLDFSEPEVLLAMAEIALLYAAKGASMLRLDAVAFAWKEDGSDCLDRPQVHAILRFLRALLDEAAPGVMLLSETNLPRDINDSYFGRGDEARLVYNFPLPPLALHAFMRGRADWLSAWAAELRPPERGRTYVNFLASHDGIGVTPARGLLPAGEFELLVAEARNRGALVSARSTGSGELPYELNTTFLDAIAEREADDDGRIRAFLSCHAAMAAIAGVPAIWFHSLVGSRNWAEGPTVTGSKRSVNRERLDPHALERELGDPLSVRGRVYSGMTAMLAARSGCRAFDPDSPQRTLAPDGSGKLLPIRPENAAAGGALADIGRGGPIFGLIRGRGDEAVLALTNVSAAEAPCILPGSFYPRAEAFDPTGFDRAAGSRLLDTRAILPPKGSLWMYGRWEGD